MKLLFSCHSYFHYYFSNRRLAYFFGRLEQKPFPESADQKLRKHEFLYGTD